MYLSYVGARTLIPAARNSSIRFTLLIAQWVRFNSLNEDALCRAIFEAISLSLCCGTGERGQK